MSSDPDINIDVPELRKQDLVDILTHFKDMVAIGNAIPCVNNAVMDIKLRDEYIVSRNPYRLAAEERKSVRGIIDDLLTNNIIRESNSPSNNT